MVQGSVLQSDTSTYFDYATGSNTVPAAVASGDGTGLNGNNEAVYGQDFARGPANITSAGGLSPYGIMGLIVPHIFFWGLKILGSG